MHVLVKSRSQKGFSGFFLIPGTGLQIPPAAQQALQMSGSLAFSAVAGKN